MVGTRDYNTVTKGLTVTATAGGASSNVVYTCPANFDAEIDFCISRMVTQLTTI
jgi:hypothetical protein